MQRIFGFYRDSRGMAAAGAQVRVYEYGTTTLETIYDDEPSSVPATPKSNPFTTDANGYWVFAAPAGPYTIQFNGANLPVYTINRFYLDEGSSTGAVWGDITGDITNQTDLINYIAAHAGGASWGSITGTLSSQTDLQTALNLKYDASNPAGYISGNQNITLSGDATGSGTTAIPVTINTFAGSTKGLVPASLGGTTNFLRADGNWAAPGGSGSITWTEIEISFDIPSYSKTLTILDASVTPTSRIIVVPCGNVATGGSEDDWEWDGITFAARADPAVSGQFKLMCFATPGPVYGAR